MTRLGLPAVAVALPATLVLLVARRDAFSGATLFALLAFLVSGLLISAVQVLSAGRSGPRAATPRSRTIGAGLTWGLVAGLVVGVALNAIPVVRGHLPVSVAAGLLVALTVTIGRGLVAAAPDTAAVSPDSLLRTDRTALLLTTGLVTAGTGVVGYLLCGHVSDAWIVMPFLLMGCAAIVVFFGSGSLWFTYTVARLWLAATGRLPWRPAHFLREARDAGVLRQDGPAYQFRHDLLSAHLAATGSPRSRRPARTGK